MPYITQQDRIRLVKTNTPGTSGELNYIITSYLNKYWNDGKHCYQRINDIVGAIEGAKAEFQRRIVGPYEDRKKDENGDVY